MFECYSTRARRIIVIALWSARRRGGSYIDAEDLLHAIIREDRGEFDSISAEIFPGASAPVEESIGTNRPFFPGSAATDLLRELHEAPERLDTESRSEKREPTPHVDMPVSHSLNKVLALVSKSHKNDTKAIEPLDLLAGIVADRDSRLAQRLGDHGITRQAVAKALDPGS